MKVLVTGASGFVGSHIAAALRQADFELRCALRSTSSTRWLVGLEYQPCPLNFQDTASIRRAVNGVDAVVHVAGITRARDPDAYREVNIEATLRLAEEALDTGVESFIFISSLAARGPDLASKDGDAPSSLYGKSKLDAERRLKDLTGGSPMRAVSLRLAGVYGPRDKDLLPLFQMAKLGFLTVPAGSGVLQPLYVDDAASSVVAALESSASFGPFEVAEQGVYSWQDVAGAMAEALDKKVRTVSVPTGVFKAVGRTSEWLSSVLAVTPRLDTRRSEDLAVHTWTSEVSASAAALGWHPQVALPEGLQRTAAWYKQQGWL